MTSTPRPAPRAPFLRQTRQAVGAAVLTLCSVTCGSPALHAQAPSSQAPSSQPKDPVAHDAPRTQQQTQRQAQRDRGGAATGQRISVPGAVALSPDGATVAWVLGRRGDSALHLISVGHPTDDGTVPLPEGNTNCQLGDTVWSPDGATLAFLGACTAPAADPTVPRQSQIYLWSKATGQTRQLTHLTGDLQQLAWSPDGKAIGFLFVENATRTAGALDAMKPWSGVIGEDGVEVQRVFAVSATSGKGHMLTPSTLHVYEFAWAPKAAGTDIAYIAAAPPGENNWWIAALYTQSLPDTLSHLQSDSMLHSGPPDDGPHVIVDTAKITGPLHGLQIAVPRWSPDGKQIAFIGGLMSDQGSTGGDLYTVSAAGGQPTDVTPNIDGTPVFETWINNNTLGFVEDRRGHTLLVDWNVSRKAVEPNSTRDLGEVSVGGGPIKAAVSFSPAKGGTIAFTEQGFTQAPEVWTATDAGARQLSHLNDSAKPTARTESVEWTNGQFHVQGWLTFPANYDPAQKYPIIVTVHGGPSASTTARWGGGQWAERGYFELQPNPRGSFGQGEAFTEANRKDFGYGDLKDIEAGMDFVESKYSIDPHREGLTGWSYGGFMTMFGVTQTHRFRAAVAGAGLSDWLSYYGENSIDQWMTPFFGASVYDDPAVYAKSSAMTFIKNVTTPTLVIVGDRDGECPAPQSFEFWHALRDLGVKTQLVVYPDEGHGFRDPDHIRDRAERTAKWFADNMPATSGVSDQHVSGR